MALIDSWNDMIDLYCEGDLIESDYFANCNVMEYYSRIVRKKRYYEKKNPQK